MEIIKLNHNFHKPKIGCICPQCKSVFTIDELDMLNYAYKKCNEFEFNRLINGSHVYYDCPNKNCGYHLEGELSNSNLFVKLMNNQEELSFKKEHLEEETIFQLFNQENPNHIEMIEEVINALYGLNCNLQNITNIFNLTDDELMSKTGMLISTPFFIMRHLLIFDKQMTLLESRPASPIMYSMFSDSDIFPVDVNAEYRYSICSEARDYAYVMYPHLVYKIYLALHRVGFITSLDSFYMI